MRRMLEDKEVDAVIIATPDHWHAPATSLACDAGKDVYVEKPVSHNLREGRNVIMAKAWNIQKRKNIGREQPAPVPSGVDYDTWVGPALMSPYKPNRFHYNWHWDWNFGTGDMGNDGAHQIDIARWALDESAPKRVSGMGGKYYFDDDQDTPDTMNLTFDYGSKALIWEMRIWSPYMMESFDNGVAVYGTDAMMLIGDWNRKWGYRIIAPDYKMIEESQEGGAEDLHMRNFIDCVISREKPNCDIEIGHLTTVHCHLGNIVSRVGRNVAYDASKETISNDPEAQALTKRKYRNHWGTPKGA
jgi:predicted dehydrogenase